MIATNFARDRSRNAEPRLRLRRARGSINATMARAVRRMPRRFVKPSRRCTADRRIARSGGLPTRSTFQIVIAATTSFICDEVVRHQHWLPRAAISAAFHLSAAVRVHIVTGQSVPIHIRIIIPIHAASSASARACCATWRRYAWCRTVRHAVGRWTFMCRTSCVSD